MTKIGFIGLGVVGGATLKLAIKHGHKDFVTHDPPCGITGDISSCDVVFISVPVPTKPNGRQDYSILNEAMRMTQPKQTVFIRSTVLPGTTEKARIAYPGRHIYAFPEFLTQRSAEKDIFTISFVASHEGADIISKIFPLKDIILVENETECEFVKYLHNAYCAMSVGFFNLMADFAEARGLSYDSCVRAAAMTTGFVPLTHAKVPGPDGSRGFGGKCLPKDLFAFSTLLGLELKRGHFLSRVLSDNFKQRFSSLF